VIRNHLKAGGWISRCNLLFSYQRHRQWGIPKNHIKTFKIKAFKTEGSIIDVLPGDISHTKRIHPDGVMIYMDKGVVALEKQEEALRRLICDEEPLKNT
jgi:hypothetical protein